MTLISQEAGLTKGIRDSDIFFNPAIPFGVEPTSGEIDFETVLLHELGHSLGLDHNDNCVVGRTVMESVVDLQELRRDLSSSEMEGVRFLYPTGDESSIRIWEREQTMHFDASKDGFAPFGQEAHIYGHEGQRWTAEASEPWVRIEPSTGLFDSQQHIEVLVDQAGMDLGTYTATVSIASEGMPGAPATIDVDLTVVPVVTEADFPQLSTGGTVNGANSSSGDFAPGSLITLYGENFSTETAQAASFPLPTTLAGVRVILNGNPAPLLYVSPTQINAQVSTEAWVGRGGVIVQNGLGQNRQIPIEVTTVAPELFVHGSGDVIAFNEDGSINGSGNPAIPGGFITVYITGVGPTDPPVAAGWPAPSNPPAVATTEAWATIDGVAAEITFIGLAPGYAGVGQVNIKVPGGVTGRLPIKVGIGDEWSNSNVTVQ